LIADLDVRRIERINLANPNSARSTTFLGCTKDEGAIMQKPELTAIILLAVIFSSAWCPGSLAQAPTPHFLIEAYPSEVEASKQNYQRQISEAGAAVSNVPFYLIVPTLQRWEPGQVVRVAFNGGDPTLYEKIATAATTWLTKGGANLTFSFKNTSGSYRVWSASDSVYSAEVRIAFGAGGYWSHVGTDSINRSLVGGSPGQASMNLESFNQTLPVDWEGIAIHEFGHALGFEHEHQNPAGGCDFRFDDDPGYIATKDAAGWYTTDANGRRPGLYTYLGGYKNFWPRPKVDQNLRALQVSSAFLTGAFDKDSVMKYFFNAFMFKAAAKSPCYTASENVTLSSQDILGVQKAYPKDNPGVAFLRTQKRATLEQLKASPGVGIDVLQHVTTQLQGL
jgi:hypothetical protein